MHSSQWQWSLTDTYSSIAMIVEQYLFKIKNGMLRLWVWVTIDIIVVVVLVVVVLVLLPVVV